MARDEELSELGGNEEFEGDEKIDELDELDGYRDLGDDSIDEDEDEDDDKPSEAAATEGEEAAPTTEIDEEDQEEEESLEALLGTDETVTEASPRVAGARAPEGIGEDEFTCRSCFLVKSRAQLADADQLICSDCA